MAERQFGPYRLVRQIAVGGMAEIHLAKTKGIAGFEKYVALKMIHPNFAEDEQFIGMLVDEAKIAVQLNHGNIAQTFDLGRVGDTFYITMEYVDGADLYKILRRGSEMDNFEMPLDVCAFIAKEVASALDHAHRKRDHTGKTLGIVHRDVSPQNVLVSFAGEVKLVDFGIAKATMKARQTAVGVIKGKYYYMSPEQAWGDQIDYRSDIFSAGIVLYEMITGQMLYLEEDLHRLLDMARKAEIAPPSTLRKGIPPQLERIVMNALKKDRRDRYQSASDFATDLERFLHAYSPVFTAAKVAQMIKQVVGGPTEIPDYEVEVRDGPIATHTLNADDLILDKEELQDENSVIFRVADLKPKQPVAEPKRVKQPTGGIAAGPRVTRQADLSALEPPEPPQKPIAKPPVKPGPKPGAKPVAIPAMPKPKRDANEHTREVAPAPSSGNTEDSGLLEAPSWKKRDQVSTFAGSDGGELENIGESTMISGGPPSFGGGFLMENAGEEGVDATVITQGAPTPPPGDDTSEDLVEDDDDMGGETIQRDVDEDGDVDGEEGPTVQRDFRDRPKAKVSAGKRAPAPPALAAKIHAPAVSELRKPRASRKTPGGGVPAAQPSGGNVLQALVAAKPSEPMPAPRPGAQRGEDSTMPAQPSPHSLPTPSPLGPPPHVPPQQMMPPQQMPQQMPPQQMAPQAYNGYATDASGLPMQTPPQGMPVQGQQPYYGQPPGYPQQPGYPPQQYPQQPGYPPQYQQYPGQPGYEQAPMTPGALYQLQPYGAPPPKPMTLTGQLRLFEADEIGAQYKVSGGGGRVIKLLIAGLLAISVAAGVTFFIIKSTRDSAPTVGTIRVESVPPGAEIIYDGERLAGVTPYTIESVPVGTRHEIKVQLARHKPYVETVDIPKRGGEVPVKALMDPITGKLRVITQPDGAEIRIDGVLRGRAPITLDGIDMSSAKVLELRLANHQPVILNLTWPANGQIDINQKLQLIR